MDCPACGAPAVAFAVPPAARDAAPGAVAAICTRCLHLAAADAPDDPPDFSPIVESFPAGEAGATLAVALGLVVDSLVLHKATIGELFEIAADRGTDPWLLLERLAASPTVRPDADLGRARRQLAQLLDT